LDESLWRWTPKKIKNADDMKRYVETALDEQRREVTLPFATVEKSSDEIVGSTRFLNIDANNRRAEIGATWITPTRQRSFINTEAKLLMLTHAFEIWNAVRVELKTDALNAQSRKAIERLGAVEEGTFRQHLFTDEGRLRDTVYYSILDSEWRKVKENLQNKLNENH
jgi:RimJ/RimL family protein N-acetyltransferase